MSPVGSPRLTPVPPASRKRMRKTKIGLLSLALSLSLSVMVFSTASAKLVAAPTQPVTNLAVRDFGF